MLASLDSLALGLTLSPGVRTPAGDAKLAMPMDIAFMLSAGLGIGFAINVGTCMPCGHACGMSVGSVLLLRTLLPSGTGMRPAMALRSGSVVARPSGRLWFCAWALPTQRRQPNASPSARSQRPISRGGRPANLAHARFE